MTKKKEIKKSKSKKDTTSRTDLLKMSQDFSKNITDIMYEVGSFKRDILSSIKSRIPIVAVETIEEKRFKCYMDHFSRVKRMKLHLWDMITGLKDCNYKKIDIDNDSTRACASEHERILAYIYNKYENVPRSQAERYREEGYRGDLYILFDFQHMMREPRIIRRLKMASEINSHETTILVDPNITCGIWPNMVSMIPVFKAPKPGLEEYKHVIQDMARGVENRLPDIQKEVDKHEKNILKSIEGKTVEEAQFYLAKNIVNNFSFLEKK